MISSIASNALDYSTEIEKLQALSIKRILDAENKLFKRLKVDQASLQLGVYAENIEQIVTQRLRVDGGIFAYKSAKSYVSKVDSMFTSINFLRQSFPAELQFQEQLAKIHSLQKSIEALQALQEVIAERKVLVESKLRAIGKLGKDYQKYADVITDCRGKFEQIKAEINEPDKLVSRALSILAQRKEFRQFFAKNSMMAGFMRLPIEDNPVDPSMLNGLQTRKEMEKLLTDRFGATDVIPGLGIKSTPMPGMQTYLASIGKQRGLKDILIENELISSGHLETVQKRKFKDRVHFGVNFQTVRASGIFPTTSDLGLSLGIDLSDRFTAGVGAAGKIGLGQSIQQIKISGQGVSFRSFIDGRIKGGIYLTASAEMNYLSEINKLDQLKEMSAWKFAGLAGLTKKIRVNQKAQANFQLLYDFFYRSTGVPTQPLLFRIGYSF